MSMSREMSINLISIVVCLFLSIVYLVAMAIIEAEKLEPDKRRVKVTIEEKKKRAEEIARELRERHEKRLEDKIKDEIREHKKKILELKDKVRYCPALVTIVELVDRLILLKREEDNRWVNVSFYAKYYAGSISEIAANFEKCISPQEIEMILKELGANDTDKHRQLLIKHIAWWAYHITMPWRDEIEQIACSSKVLSPHSEGAINKLSEEMIFGSDERVNICTAYAEYLYLYNEFLDQENALSKKIGQDLVVEMLVSALEFYFGAQITNRSRPGSLRRDNIVESYKYIMLNRLSTEIDCSGEDNNPDIMQNLADYLLKIIGSKHKYEDIVQIALERGIDEDQLHSRLLYVACDISYVRSMEEKTFLAISCRPRRRYVDTRYKGKEDLLTKVMIHEVLHLLREGREAGMYTYTSEKYEDIKNKARALYRYVRDTKEGRAHEEVYKDIMENMPDSIPLEKHVSLEEYAFSFAGVVGEVLVEAMLTRLDTTPDFKSLDEIKVQDGIGEEEEASPS